MKHKIIISLAFVFLTSRAISVLAFNVEDNLWKTYSQGISIAVVLSKSNDAAEGGDLRIWVRNDSSDILSYSKFGMDSGIHLYYLNNKGFKIYLNDYPVRGRERIERLHEDEKIKSGDAFSIQIHLDKKRYDLARSHPMFCNLMIRNQTNGSSFEIDSGPWVGL